MKSFQRIARYMMLGVSVMLLAACSTQMQPARQAIDNINKVLDTVPADAQQYIPDQLGDVEHKLADLNASFDKKDYAAVLAGAPAVLTEAQGLAAAVAAKKDDALKALAAQWTQLSSSVPELIASVKGQVETLSKKHRVPEHIDLGSAKSGLADATQLWDKAQASFQAKDLAGAVATGKDAQSKIEAAQAALKMS